MTEMAGVIGDEDGAATSGTDSLAEEERRLTRLVATDPAAFTVLYERYYGKILNYLYRRVRDRDIAEDLASQVFLSSFQYLSRTQRDVVFFAWVYRIAMNVWLTHERSRKGWFARLEAWAGIASKTPDRPDARIEENERTRLLRREIFSLPPRYREPLLLRYYEEMSYEEIAQVMGISQTGVRSRMKRALTNLRRRVSDREETGGSNGQA